MDDDGEQKTALMLAVGLQSALLGKTPEQMVAAMMRNLPQQQPPPQQQAQPQQTGFNGVPQAPTPTSTPAPPPALGAVPRQRSTNALVTWSKSQQPLPWRPQLFLAATKHTFELVAEFKTLPVDLKADEVIVMPQKLNASQFQFKESIQELLENGGIQPTFFFDCPQRLSNGQFPAPIQERIDLRESLLIYDQSALSLMVKVQAPNQPLDRAFDWEMQILRPKGSDGKLRGYLYKKAWFVEEMTKARDALLLANKLPLVLDLDDTVLRAVGNDSKKVPPAVAQSDAVKHRLRQLSTGTQVVLAEGVDAFLDWACTRFEISVCSLGDPEYVNSIVSMLDPKRQKITGRIYSARFAYDVLKDIMLKSGNGMQKQPTPKDVRALYSFCYLHDGRATLPLIIEDTKDAWIPSQIDNIIEVGPVPNAPVWTVYLTQRVIEVLDYVHTEFFREYATRESNNVVPSAVVIYHRFLQNALRQRITEPPELQARVTSSLLQPPPPTPANGNGHDHDDSDDNMQF